MVCVIADVMMCGSFMEMVYAHRGGKPIYVVDLTEEGNMQNHAWVEFHSKVQVQGWDALEPYLAKLNEIQGEVNDAVDGPR
jgi:hypothetical protein